MDPFYNALVPWFDAITAFFNAILWPIVQFVRFVSTR